MDVNKIKILNSTTIKEITFPLSMNWDLYDREGAIIQEEENIIREVIGEPTNYELVRFSRRPINLSITNQVYEFNFYSASTAQWVNSYLPKFTENQVLYYSNPFKKSFFKLDLYDTPDPLTQKIYLSIILSTNQSVADLSVLGQQDECNLYRFYSAIAGSLEFTNCCGDLVIYEISMGQTIDFCSVEPSTMSLTYFFPALGEQTVTFPINGTSFEVIPFILNFLGTECSCTTQISQGLNYLVKPEINLDHIGDQKGYFIHWYQDRDLIGLDELYMRAKFFNGNTGTYTVFTREPQSNYVGNENRLPNELFYYQLHFDYSNFYYWFSNFINDDIIQTLEWYEYVNPNT